MSFEDIFLEVLGKHAPLKNKLMRAKYTPYATELSRKAITKNSYLG